MPTDFSSSDNDPISTETEGSMFAPIPSWERGKKRRMFGGERASRVAPEPRSFAAEFSAEPEPAIAATPTRPVYVRSEDFVDQPDAAFAATPAFAGSTTRKGNGAAPIAIAAGVILLGGLAAAGWYATQPHDQGVAQLTPGASTTTTVATTPGDTTTGETSAPTQVAQTTTPVVAKSTTTTTMTHAAAPAVSHTTTVARARPVSRSAADIGSNASVRAPAQAAPMPAPSAAPAPAAAAPAPPAPLVLTIPAQPAPTTTAPAEATPPTQTPPN